MSANQFAQTQQVTPEDILYKIRHGTETGDDIHQYVAYRSLSRLQERCKQTSSSDDAPSDQYYAYMNTCLQNHAGKNPIQAAHVFSCFVPGIFNYDTEPSWKYNTSIFDIFTETLGAVRGDDFFLNKDKAKGSPIRFLYTVEHELTHQEQKCNSGTRTFERAINSYEELARIGRQPDMELDADIEAARYVPLACAQAQEYVGKLTQLFTDIVKPAVYASSAQKYAWLIKRCQQETSHGECSRQSTLFARYGTPVWEKPEFQLPLGMFLVAISNQK